MDNLYHDINQLISPLGQASYSMFVFYLL